MIEADTTHRPAWLALLVALAATALALTLATAPVARAGDGAPQHGIEVAPGVYLASASKLATPSHGRAGPTSTDSASVSKIVGGTTSDIRRWPWQVSIGYLPIAPKNPYKNHSCGGTLVAPTIVVTAAHCMTLGPNVDFKPASDFQVISGRTRLSSSAGQVHGLADYFWFVDQSGKPLWDPNTGKWDVVYLRLASPRARGRSRLPDPTR